MLTGSLENETEIKQSMIADNFGENGDLTEQVDRHSQVVVRLKAVLTHLTERASWSIVQKCGRNG